MSQETMDVAESLMELESAGWPDVMDRLTQGFCHSLNGRTSSLMGLVYLAQKRGGGDSTWVHPMETELERLEALVRLMEGVPHDGLEHLEPTSLAEILPGVVGLHGLQKGLEGVEVTHRIEEAPPIFMNPTVLTRSLLLLLSWVGEHARRGGRMEVEVSLFGEESGACLTLHPRGDDGDPGPMPSAAPGGSGVHLREGMLDRLERVLAGSGGRLAVAEVGVKGSGVRVWFPSLAQAKKGRKE